MSHGAINHPFPFGTGVQTLDKHPDAVLPLSERDVRNMRHFTSAIRRKTEIVFQQQTARAL